MGNDSIFDLDGVFGYESPFGNWQAVTPKVGITYLKTTYNDDPKDATKDSLKIDFSVTTNFDDTNALITLHTFQQGSYDLKLPKKAGSTPLKTGENLYSITLNKSAYDTHFKQTAGTLEFYFTVTSNDVTYKGIRFRIKALKMIIDTVDSVMTTKSMKVIGFHYKSVGLTDKMVHLQVYQQVNGVDEIITGLQKDIKIESDDSSGKISILESAVTTRLTKNGSSLYVFYSSAEGIEEYHSEPIDLTKDSTGETDTSCGIEYADQVYCVKYGTKYGPRHRGSMKMEDYEGWASLIADGRITERNKTILIAMSENEGNLDAVQGYDDQIATVGAMQKVIDPTGAGEFPLQMYEFSQTNPDLYKALFSDCGWRVEKKGNTYTAYYDNITGSALKKKILENFSAKVNTKATKCPPLLPLINACKNAEFQAKQVEDFITRLEKYLAKKPVGYDFTINSYIETDLGRATVLDQSVNRPGHVVEYFAQALTKFFKANTIVPKDPTTWGNKHNSYEKKFLDIYGPLREKEITSSENKTLGGMTDGKKRYDALKLKLPIQ